MSSTMLAHLLPMFPGILAIVTLLILCLVALIGFTLHRARKKAKPDASSEAPQEEVASHDEKKKRIPLELAAFAPSFDLRVSFARALKFMQSSIAGRDYRYQVPWFMLVGETGSGKTTLLNESDLASSGERPDFKVEHSVRWRFFDRGIILDVPGEYFLRGENATADEGKWQQLLRLLQKHRPRRPIDGIILTLPCADLLEELPSGQAALREKAAFIYEKLWRAQKTLGLCFPVYVIVTQCDLIEGFKAFCRQLPRSRHRDIFGWSSPYHLDAAFTSRWIDEAFESLSRSLHGLQSEVLLEVREPRDRDEVFVFPSRFQTLRAPLKLFLDQLFKQTAYRESFRLRGLYFCGDVQTEPLDVLLALPETELQIEAGQESEHELALSHPPALGGTLPKAPIFLTHLFEEKIFPESGLARPFSSAFISRNRTVVATQVLSVSLVIILGLGLLFGYKRLSMEKQDRLLPMLRLIAEDRSRLQNAPALNAADFSNNAYDLLFSMASLGRWGYRALFIPGSWFSHINSRIASAMVPAFEFEVLKTFRIELENRARKLTGFSPPAQQGVSPTLADPAGPGVPQLISVTKTPEYEQLQQFTQGLATLQENIDRYEVLARRQQGSPDDLRQLVNYLNDRALPSNFDYEGNRLFQKALEDSTGAPFTYQPADKQRASAEMNRLVANLFNSWVAHNVVSIQVDNLQQKIVAMQQGQIQTYQDLSNLLSSIAQVKGLLSHPDFAWIGGNGFELSGPVYEVTEGAIPKSKFFTPALQGSIQNAWQAAFQTLRANLAEQGTDLTGPLLEWTAGKVQLTPEIANFQLALGNVLNLPFIAMEPEGTMRTEIAPGTSLMWDAGLLQQAVGLRESYDRFIQEGLRDCPAVLKETLRHIALDRLQLNTMGLIGQAQTFQPRPKSSVMLGLAQDVLPEVKNFQAASSSLEQLLNEFQALGLGTSRAALLRLTTQQAANLLAGLDQNLSAGEPYAIKGGSFDWWNGQTSPSLGAFDTQSPAALKGYLAFQQQRLQSYAQQAEPLITFLANTGFSGQSESQTQLINKWTRIITAFNKYNAKIPGNSVAALNDFITSGMDKISPTNYCQAGSGADSTGPGSDYFLQVRDSLHQGLDERCIAIAEQTASQNYTAMAAFFNQNLEGKFPFCTTAQQVFSNEADPHAIQQFYLLFDQDAPATITVLKQTQAFGNTAKPALAFLNQMERLRPFFASFLPGGVGAAVPVFDFMPYFRVNQSREVGGNQILEWKLQVGDQQFRYHDGTPHPGRWQWGDPIQIDLRWAENSPLVPVSKGGEPDLAINNREVVFHYNDPWSLLTLLLRHHAPAMVFPAFVDPDPYTLEFTVATTQALAGIQKDVVVAAPEVRVYIRVNLMLPGKTQVLLLPEFPTAAPQLKRKSAAES